MQNNLSSVRIKASPTVGRGLNLQSVSKWFCCLKERNLLDFFFKAKFILHTFFNCNSAHVPRNGSVIAMLMTVLSV